MRIRSLNGIFDHELQPKTKPRSLPRGMSYHGRFVADDERVSLHEYRLGDTLVLVPENERARSAGVPRMKQALELALIIMSRVDGLRGGVIKPIRVLVFTANPGDAMPAVFAGFVNGLHTVAVDSGEQLSLSRFTRACRRFVARGGVLRPGGKVRVLIEDYRAMSADPLPTFGTPEPDLASRAIAHAGFLDPAELRELSRDFFVDQVVAQAKGQLDDFDPKIGLSAFGATAIVDAHGEGMQVAGSLFGIARGRLVASTEVAEQPDDPWDCDHAIVHALDADWPRGIPLQHVGLGEPNPAEAIAASVILRRALGIGPTRDGETARACQRVERAIQLVRDHRGEDFEFWQERLEEHGQMPIMMTLASPQFVDACEASMVDQRALAILDEFDATLMHQHAESGEQDDETLRNQLAELERTRERHERQAVAASYAVESTICASETMAALLPAGAPFPKAKLVEHWLVLVTRGMNAQRALDSFVFDSDGGVRAGFVQDIDACILRARLKNSPGNVRMLREDDFLANRLGRAARIVVASGITSREYCEVKELSQRCEHEWSPLLPALGLDLEDRDPPTDLSPQTRTPTSDDDADPVVWLEDRLPPGAEYRHDDEADPEPEPGPDTEQDSDPDTDPDPDTNR